MKEEGCDIEMPLDLSSKCSTPPTTCKLLLSVVSKVPLCVHIKYIRKSSAFLTLLEFVLNRVHCTPLHITVM